MTVDPLTIDNDNRPSLVDYRSGAQALALQLAQRPVPMPIRATE